MSKTMRPIIERIPFTSPLWDLQRFRRFKRFRRRGARAIVDRIRYLGNFHALMQQKSSSDGQKKPSVKGSSKGSFYGLSLQNFSLTYRIGKIPIQSLHLFDCRLHPLI